MSGNFFHDRFHEKDGAQPEWEWEHSHTPNFPAQVGNSNFYRNRFKAIILLEVLVPLSARPHSFLPVPSSWIGQKHVALVNESKVQV